MHKIRITQTMKWALGEPCEGTREFVAGEEHEVPGVIGLELMTKMVKRKCAEIIPEPKTTKTRKTKSMRAPENK